LVRDPRAVSYSWLRPKITPDERRPRHMRGHGAVASSVMWDAWNLGAELLWRAEPRRYFRLRYEDFVARPRDSVLRILDWLGEPTVDLPFLGERTVHLEANHTVSGNPSRFRTGLIEVEVDDEWLSFMRPRDRVAVTALTSPLLRRFGYPLDPRRSHSPLAREVVA
jgi:Sulfotransferase domain